MKCSTCAKQGLRSRVTPGVGSMTLMYFAPFYNEDGAYHHHDGNTMTTPYSCSHGHEWMETSNPSCPNISCDWPKEETTADAETATGQ